MSVTPSRSSVAHEIAEQTVRARHTVDALGQAIRAAHVTASPSLARAAQAEANLYDRIEAEFGLLTSAEAGMRMGSRSSATRNLALTARQEKRLLALRRGRYQVFPGFQFDQAGVRPVIGTLIELGAEHGRTEAGLVQWLMAPTTALNDRRPVDVIDDPHRLLVTARDAFSVQW